MAGAKVPDWVTKQQNEDWLRGKVRWLLDRGTWTKDVIVNCAIAFGAFLFVLAGLYGGFMLLHAMQGMFGTLGCILAVAFSGGAVAVGAYFENLREQEDAEIEAEVEAEYEALKEEEQRLISDLRDRAEDCEIEHQLRIRRELLNQAKESKERLHIQELNLAKEAEENEEPLLQVDEITEKQLDTIERLHRIRDRLESLGAGCSESPTENVAKECREAKENAAREPAPEMEADSLREPAEEPPPGAAAADGAAAAEVLRRATLRRRATASTAAASSSSTADAAAAEEER